MTTMPSAAAASRATPSAGTRAPAPRQRNAWTAASRGSTSHASPRAPPTRSSLPRSIARGVVVRVWFRSRFPSLACRCVVRSDAQPCDSSCTSGCYGEGPLACHAVDCAITCPPGQRVNASCLCVVRSPKPILVPSQRPLTPARRVRPGSLRRRQLVCATLPRGQVRRRRFWHLRALQCPVCGQLHRYCLFLHHNRRLLPPSSTTVPTPQSPPTRTPSPSRL